MACLSLSNGSFAGVSFSTSLSGTAAGENVSLGAGGLSVGGSLVLNAISGFQLSAAILGGQFVVAMSVENAGSGFPSQRKIFVINVAPKTATQVLQVTATSSAISLPSVQSSPGTPSLIAVWAPDGSGALAQIVGAGIFRSDNGAGVVTGIGSFTATGTILGGEITATQVRFRFHSGGSAQTATAPRPVGKSNVTTANPQSFGSVPIGGCPVTPPTRTYTIRNDGTDCLTINSISNSGPYTFVSAVPALPETLDPGQDVDVVIRFAPTAIGMFNNVGLAINPTPPDGELTLIANGSGVAAAPSVTFNQTTFNYNKVPNGVTPPPKTLTITNNGTAPLTVTVAAGSANGFSWNAVGTTLTCGAAATVTINFTAGLPEGPKSASFSVTHSAGGSPQNISLLASVCVANPLITAPAAAPIDFGQIQQGFKTVKLLQSVQNPGDGPLTFTAEIISTGGGATAQALFGVPDPQGGQITGPQSRNITINPTDPCGGTAGTGTVDVPISFRADLTPAVITGIALRIRSTNPVFTRDYPLSVEIVPPIPLDISLVIDNSGSMNDPLGSRTKIEAAVSAGQLFVELLRPDLDDRVALVKFNTSPAVVQSMTAVTTIGAPTQDQIRNLVATGVPPAAGWTGITGGTILGIKEVQTARATVPPVLTKAVVVLTDGIENRAHEEPPGSGNWFTLLGGPSFTPANAPIATNPMAFPGDIKVFAVGLGRNNEVSPAQLDALMHPAGTPFRVDQDLSGTKYFELEKKFTQIYMDVTGVATVTDPMYWIGPGDKHAIEFEVLRGDVDALVILYDWEGLRLPFHCVSPQGEIIDPASIPPGFQLRSGFTPKTRIVEFKMPWTEPKRYAGTWKVIIEHPGVVCRGGLQAGANPDVPVGFVSRRGCKEVKVPLLYGIAIGVGSNFRMQPFVTPGPVYVGDPILLTAVVTEAGLPVTGGTVTVKYETPTGATGMATLKDDGAHNDGDPDNGEYARMFTSTMVDGVYHFTFRAEGKSRDGKTIVREAVRDKEVLRKGRPPGDGGPNGSDGPGGKHPGDGGHAGDGGRPGDDGRDECCEKLLRVLREQTAMLKKVLDDKG